MTCQMGCCDGLHCECCPSSELPSQKPLTTTNLQHPLKSAALLAKAPNLVQPTEQLPKVAAGVFIEQFETHLRPPLELHCALLI